MILADSGFWVALLCPEDRHHALAVAAGSVCGEEPLMTTWPVLTEVCHIIGAQEGPGKVVQFLDQVAAGCCEVVDLPKHAIPIMRQLMHKYRDRPMDLADASLVWLAAELGEGRILSTDERDFKTYRWKSTKPFKNLLLSG